MSTTQMVLKMIVTLINLLVIIGAAKAIEANNEKRAIVWLYVLLNIMGVWI